MSNGTLRPTTNVGIKRLAKKIKAERGISHLNALDEAAKIAGFENFRHARNARGATAHQGPDTASYSLYITFYWKDHENGTEGRETLSVDIPVPWSDLVTQAQMAHFRGFADLQPEGPDHLVGRVLVESQERARRNACHAARGFHFMHATKLRPTGAYSRAFPQGNSRNRIPGADHSSIWYASKLKAYVFVDEPYEGKADRNAEARTAWAENHGYHLTKVMHWPGMYNPDGGSRMYLIADRKKIGWLVPYATALDVLPRIEAPSWSGVSAPRVPRFTSPGTTAAETARASLKAAPPVRSSATRGTTRGYVQALVGPQRRPDAKMTIETHQKVASHLKAVHAATYERKGIYNRVDAVRSELDEWVMREYDRDELPSEVFHDLYYGAAPSTSFARSLSQAQKTKIAAMLNDVKSILQANYPDCAPLRRQMKKLDAALTSLDGWMIA